MKESTKTAIAQLWAFEQIVIALDKADIKFYGISVASTFPSIIIEPNGKEIPFTVQEVKKVDGFSWHYVTVNEMEIILAVQL